MKKVIILYVLLTVNFLFVIRSTQDCYCQWQPDVRLTNDPANSYTSYNNAWCVASSGNFVHVVWFDYRDGNGEIYYKRSTDAGISWGNDTRLTNNPSYSQSPSVSVIGSFVHVVWFDYRDGNDEIYYKRSTDAGISWGSDTRLTNDSAYSRYPSVSVSGMYVHVVWEDKRDNEYVTEIYYKRSTDDGISWETDIRLTLNINPFRRSPSVSVSGPFVHVVWEDGRNGNKEIYYKQSADNGLSWEADKRLTNDIAFSYLPSVSASGSSVHAVWFDNRDGNYEIYCKSSSDNGLNWGADIRLTNDIAFSYLPSVSVSGSFVHVAWEDNRDGNYEIYYKRSADNGVSWNTDTSLTNNTASSVFPSVSASDSFVNVVWYDYRDGNYEIYFKQNPTGNLFGIGKINSEIPKEFKLHQNYPNPFNPSTRIKFDIPQTGRTVLLTIYDVLGRKVETLVDEELKPGTPACRSLGAGRYEVVFDGTKYPSGVYFYRLSAGKYDETKKMVLIK